jgi:hypothetical protein
LFLVGRHVKSFAKFQLNCFTFCGVFNAILTKADALGILAVIIVTTATGRAMLTVNAVRTLVVS